MEGVIKINDKKYPWLLREIGKDAPKQIYYKGNWDLSLFENCLAVVGSRRVTTYGKTVVKEMVSQIATAGVTIVSGFMYGVDATAHKAALDTKGKTIAVMPCGADIIHPQYQEKLYNEILKGGGLILSEYEKGFPPSFWTYPKRNRIVAGISKATLIIEAAKKSGSLITADFAKKYKRKIFAVPGPINSFVSKGTNNLIKEGTEIALEANDILKFFNLKINNSKNGLLKEEYKKKGIEREIIEKLKNEPVDIDSLSRMVNCKAAEIGAILSLMELKELVFEENGKYYIKET